MCIHFCVEVSEVGLSSTVDVAECFSQRKREKMVRIKQNGRGIQSVELSDVELGGEDCTFQSWRRLPVRCRSTS